MFHKNINILLLIIIIVLAILVAYKLTHENFLTQEDSNTALTEQSLQQNSNLQKSNEPTLTIGQTILKLEIADTEAERVQGLSGRELLPEDTGLLFVFDQPGQYGIWMKDMKFAIDIIWLDENFNVVGLKENATPESFPDVFTPRSSAKYVLETNTAFIKNNGITYDTIMALTNI